MLNVLARMPSSRASFVFALATFFATLPLSSFGAVGAQIRAIVDSERPTGRFDLQVDDTWANACAPRLESVELDGLDLWIFAHDESEGAFCGQSPTPYSLDTRGLPVSPKAPEANGVLRVHYVVKSSGGLRLRGFALIASGADSPAPELESGYWWADPTRPSPWAGRGIGLNLERQGEILSGVLFGYGESGEPDWSIGAGRVGEHFTQLTLSRLSDGRGPRGPYQDPRSLQSLGDLLIQPLSPAHARLWIVYLEPGTQDLSLRDIHLSRFGFGHTPATMWAQGPWVLFTVGVDGAIDDVQQFTFADVQLQAKGFTLIDAERQAALSCTPGTDIAAADRVPETCTLSLMADGETADLRFDQVGLRRMQGKDAQGRTLRLIHLDAN